MEISRDYGIYGAPPPYPTLFGAETWCQQFEAKIQVVADLTVKHQADDPVVLGCWLGVGLIIEWRRWAKCHLPDIENQRPAPSGPRRATHSPGPKYRSHVRSRTSARATRDGVIGLGHRPVARLVQ